MSESNQTKSDWYLYIVENRLGQWYTGITIDLERRLRQHNDGTGAKSLRGKGPVSLVVAVSHLSKVNAAKLEWQVKQLSKHKKRQLVAEVLSSTCERTNLVIAFDTCVSLSKLISSNESLTE
ncbi:GIY-YIG nuclease family protein [Pseudoalteromonas luteoviolacea]|uniref:GIY-YIG nuclease family protein n=1 Tax=Pseudoalteromonas luteoviolacea TaxID=43657 RepID=UPI0009C00DA8|nr:GIY-YIG nuclease family protein [Pseudoalteromonas luteoviolacea]